MTSPRGAQLNNEFLASVDDGMDFDYVETSSTSNIWPRHVERI